MFKSIRWRIAGITVLLIIVLMGGLEIYLSNFVRKIHINNLEENLTLEAHIVADEMLSRMKDTPWDKDYSQQVDRWSNLFGARVTIIDPIGVVLADSSADPKTLENHINRPEIQQAMDSGLGKAIRYSQSLGYSMMYVGVPIKDKGELFGFGRIAIPLTQVEASIASLQRTIIAVTFIALLLAVFFSIIIADQITIPLRRLAETARRISSGDSRERFIPTTNDELSHLGYAIETMAQQLQDQIKSLQDEQNKLEAILGQLNDGVVIADQEGRVVLVNPTAERLFDIKSNKAIGRTLPQVVHHHQLVELWQMNQSTGDEQALMMELPYKGIFVQAIATPLSHDLSGFTLLLFQDLTELRRLENVRRDFVSNISHELRTPLASLKALAETLQDGALDDPNAARKFLKRIDVEVDALSHMVSELLELSRIESGRVPLQLDRVNPCGIFHQAYSRLLEQADRAKITMVFKCDDTLPAILADAPRLEQVFVNLVHNAVKFTPEGGEIILEGKRKGDFIRFIVKDNGIGIPSKDLPRIFERFYKSDQSRASGGTGLGLAIARHLVEGHGGHIWVESEEGRGSKFILEIPIAD